MKSEQLKEIRHIIWAAKELGKEATKAERKLSGDIKDGTREALEIELPDWIDDEYEILGGDAGKANSTFFRVYFKRSKVGERDSTELVILCPTFLRGWLRVNVRDARDNRGHGVHGAY